MKKEEIRDPLDVLPDRINLEIYEHYLSGSDLGRALMVSSAWKQLYSDRLLWRKKLSQDFGLSKELLKYIGGLGHPQTEFLCYRGLINLTRNLSNNILSPIISSALDPSETEPTLLVRCLMDDTTLLAQVSPMELFKWFIISCFAGDSKIPTSFLKVLPIDQKILADVVGYSGNLEVMKYALNPALNLNLTATDYCLWNAVYSGNKRLVDFLMKTVQVKFNEYYFKAAVLSNSLEMVKLIYKNLLKPGELSSGFLREMLNFTAQAGNTKIVNYFLDPQNNFKLKPSAKTLDSVALSGNLLLFKELLNNNSFGLKPTIDTLNSAAASGNPALLNYLLDRENNFNLKPTEDTLRFSATASNDTTFNFLLDPKRGFGFRITLELLNIAVENNNIKIARKLLTDPELAVKPDQTTLLAAAEGGSLGIVKLLVEKFGLTPDEDTLSKAVQGRKLEVVRYLTTTQDGCSIPVATYIFQLAETPTSNNLILRYFLDPESMIIHPVQPPKPGSYLSDCRTLLRKAVNAVLKEEPFQKLLEEAKQLDPLYFYLTIDYVLKIIPGAFKQIAGLPIIQDSPYPPTQLLLANAGREGLIDLSSDQITQLYQKALAGFQALAWDSQAAKVESYLSSQPKQP